MTPNLTPDALAELALDYERPRYYLDGTVIPHQSWRDTPLFVNNCGPFLLRKAPVRLVPISMRTAYAIVRAGTRFTWPAYSPQRDWVVRAVSAFFHGY